MSGSRRKSVAIIGAGVVGLSVAYVMAREGYDVTLIDRNSEPGRGASAGNAAQLSWAYCDAMASPSLFWQLPKIMAGRDENVRIEWRLEPSFLLWGVRFLLNTRKKRWWANTSAILELAERSRIELNRLQREVELSFSFRQAGKLHLYSTTKSFRSAGETVDKKMATGIVQRMIGREEAERLEPALAAYTGDIAGAVYSPEDSVGDAAEYCRVMLAHLQSVYQVRALFTHEVCGFSTSEGKLRAIKFFDHDEIEAEMAVIAGGPSALTLAREVPEVRAINPVRGYSLTVPRSANSPYVSLTDVQRKLAIASIGDRLRVAGIADIASPKSGYDSKRFDTLRRSVDRIFPELFAQRPDEVRWSGERPMTPCSRPIIAPSRNIGGLFVNIGHGMLGWTLCLGSARALLEVIESA